MILKNAVIVPTVVSRTRRSEVVNKSNERWGSCITKLLSKHGLSTRAAEIKCNYAVSSTYIGTMMKGKLPQYETAIAFLECFPKTEAIECLKAGGFPVPVEWQPTDLTTDEQFIIHAYRSASTPAERKKLEDIAREICEEEEEEFRNGTPGEP